MADKDGNVIQTNDYDPFGATLASNDKQPYKYNGKEEDKSLKMYDYSARYYDANGLPKFSTMDPMAEKYYSISPYAYVGNNPIKFIDPTGMIWDNPKDADKLKNNIDKKISSLNNDISKNQEKLDKGGLSDKQIAKIEGQISETKLRISNLNKSKADIDRLGDDKNNIYALSKISGGEHKVRQGSDGKVYIETFSDAYSIHEITHVRQSLNAGGLEFSAGGELLNSAKGTGKSYFDNLSEMEIEAYKMQYSYDRSFPGNTGGRELYGIDVHSVGNLRNDKGKVIYDKIYEYSDFIRKQQKLGLIK